MSAQTIFDLLKASITHAVDTKNDFFYTKQAEALGFKGGQYDHGMSLAYNYKLQISDQEEIQVEYRSVDPSGPLQNVPDINKFELFWRKAGKVVASHRDEYQD